MWGCDIVHAITMYRRAAPVWSAQTRLRSRSARDASLDSARALWSAQAGLRFGWTRSVFVFYNRRKSTNRSGIQSGVQPPHSRVLRTIQSASRVASRRWVAMQRAASGGRGLRGNPKRRRAAALHSAGRGRPALSMARPLRADTHLHRVDDRLGRSAPRRDDTYSTARRRMSPGWYTARRRRTLR